MPFVDKIVDHRALAGAISLVLVGVQLSVMMAFYFIPGGEIFAVLQSRWWWELALNLQIVCFFLMYLSHSVRMKKASRSRKLRAWWRFLVGTLGVSVPSWVTVIAANYNWFREPPKQEDLVYFTTLVFVVWFTSAYVLPFVVSVISREEVFLNGRLNIGLTRNKVLFLSPMIFLVCLYVAELVLGGHSHIIMWPCLTYFYGSLFYFVAAFSPKKRKA